MKKKLVASLLCVAMATSMMMGCSSPSKSNDTKTEDSSKAEDSETPDDSDGYNKSAMPAGDIEVEEASAEKVQEFMNDSDEKTVLVDARPQESYSGWALEESTRMADI